MNETRKTLLARVRDPGDRDAWSEFYELYAPLLYRYARAQRLDPADAEEVRDQCLALVVEKLPDFEYDEKKGGFKAWLWRIAAGKVVDRRRGQRLAPAPAEAARLEAVADRGLAPDEAWEAYWRREHLRYGLEQARDRVPEKSWRAFEMLLLEDKSVSAVSAELGMNANQVYKAKGLVLRHVREVMTRLGVES